MCLKLFGLWRTQFRHIFFIINLFYLFFTFFNVSDISWNSLFWESLKLVLWNNDKIKVVPAKNFELNFLKIDKRRRIKLAFS